MNPFFVVRSPQPGKDASILQLTANTWNAYNDFGGSSLYVALSRAFACRTLALAG